MTLKTLRPPLRFPDHGVAGLRPRPRRSLLGAAHVQLPLHHGPPQTQTSTRHHWPAGSSYGELVLCQTSLSDPVNCSNRCCSSVGRATCSLCQDLSGVHFLLVLWIQVYKLILENFLLPQHPVLMDQMVHFYIRRLSVSTPLHYSIFHTAVWCSAAAHELTVIRLSKHESRQHPELPSHSWASKYCSRWLAINKCTGMFRAVFSCPPKAHTLTHTHLQYTQKTWITRDAWFFISLQSTSAVGSFSGITELWICFMTKNTKSEPTKRFRYCCPPKSQLFLMILQTQSQTDHIQMIE